MGVRTSTPQTASHTLWCWPIQASTENSHMGFSELKWDCDVHRSSFIRLAVLGIFLSSLSLCLMLSPPGTWGSRAQPM